VAAEKRWTNEDDYTSWFDQRISEPHAASMRRIGGAYFPETVVLSGRYRELMERTTISLSLLQRDLDIQRALNVVRVSIEQANVEQLIVPGGGNISFGPIGTIDWVLDDGIAMAVSTYTAVRSGRTFVFSDAELPYDPFFWADYWIFRAMLPMGLR
jgi:hypothetical protein